MLNSDLNIPSYKEIFEWRNALIETKKQEEELDA